MDTDFKEQNILPFIKNGFIYDILKKDDIEEAGDCLTSAFIAGAPPIIALGIKKDEFRLLAEILCNRAAKDGFSLTVKECNSGKLIGTMINEDFDQGLLTEPPPNLDRLNSKFKPTLAMIKQLHDKYRKEHYVKAHELLRMVIVGVDQKYSGKKIGATLGHLASIIAKRNQYKGIILEVTSPVSQKICYSIGYEFIDSVNYSDFEFNGKKVFATITACEGCHLVYKKL